MWTGVYAGRQRLRSRSYRDRRVPLVCRLSSQCASAWGLKPHLAQRLSPAAFDALPAVTLSGLLDRPSWQGYSYVRAARAYADARATQHPDRDMFIFNTFMRTTMGESAEEYIAEVPPPTGDAVPRHVGARPLKPPSRAAAVFLERATDLFRNVILAPSGFPCLRGGGEFAEEDPERSALATSILHPELAKLLQQPAGAGEPRKGAAAVARIVGAKVVDAFAVWDGTICADDLLKGGMEQFSEALRAHPELKGCDTFPRPTDRLLADELGHSVSLHSAPSGPLHAFLASRGHNMGLHPLRRASMRVTVAFDCLESPLDAACTALNDTPGVATAPPALLRAIHTLTLEADIEAEGVPLCHTLSGVFAWSTLVRALMLPLSLTAALIPVLRYFIRPPALSCPDGWRVVSIDGAGGGDGVGHRALSFTQLYEVGRVLGRGSTFKRMHDASYDRELVVAADAAGAIVSTLDVFSRELAAIRGEWNSSQGGSSESSAPPTFWHSTLALHAPITDLHGLSVAEALGVALRAAGAAARAVSDVSKGATRPPWLIRAQFEGWWEDIEAGCEVGAPPASPDAIYLFRWWTATELKRLDCFAEASLLELQTRADGEEVANPLTRADLTLVSATLARLDAAAAAGPVCAETTPAGVRPLGTEPWELTCDRRRRAASRRAIFEGVSAAPGRIDPLKTHIHSLSYQPLR